MPDQTVPQPLTPQPRDGLARDPHPWPVTDPDTPRTEDTPEAVARRIEQEEERAMTDPAPDIDWTRDDWGGRVHVASDYGPGIEEADEQ